jgi:hypothetical protein
MSATSTSRQKFQFVNIGWACTDTRKENSAKAYAVNMSAKQFDEIGNLVHQFRYATIKQARYTTAEGLPTNRKTGYGRMTVMYSAEFVPGSFDISDTKTKRGEYLLPYT